MFFAKGEVWRERKWTGKRPWGQEMLRTVMREKQGGLNNPSERHKKLVGMRGFEPPAP